MKNLICLLGLALLNSCTMETFERSNKNYVGSWVLIKTTGNVEDSELTGNEMPFQESYFLKEDGTFVKTRVEKGGSTEVRGTYSLGVEEGAEEAPRTYIRMFHDTGNPIIANCTASYTEFLYFSGKDRMLGTWNACDGLGLEYRKAEGKSSLFCAT